MVKDSKDNKLKLEKSQSNIGKTISTNDTNNIKKNSGKKNSSNSSNNKSQLEEIDNLFGNLSSKKAEKKNNDSTHKLNKVKEPVEKNIDDESDNLVYGQIKSAYNNFIISPEAPLERIDPESGLPVYKAHLLKVGEGGGTSLCPFDCDCCF